jgi:hypothetical protein
MADSTKALLCGMGGVGDVAAALCNLPKTEGAMVHNVQNVAIGLGDLLLTADGRRAATALACSVLNASFATTGKLWRVKDDGGLDDNYIGSGAGRDAIVDLLGL